MTRLTVDLDDFLTAFHAGRRQTPRRKEPASYGWKALVDYWAVRLGLMGRRSRTIGRPSAPARAKEIAPQARAYPRRGAVATSASQIQGHGHFQQRRLKVIRVTV